MIDLIKQGSSLNAQPPQLPAITERELRILKNILRVLVKNYEDMQKASEEILSLADYASKNSGDRVDLLLGNTMGNTKKWALSIASEAC